MGGGASAIQSLWSPEEELAIKQAKITQKRAAEYVIKYFFDGVPTRTNKHSQDPMSPVFVQPDDGSALNRAKEGIDNKYFKLIPTTVMLGSDGLIRVIFMDAEITYNLTLEQVEAANAALSVCQTITGPDPPLLHEAFRTSLDIYWMLPYPPGISQVVEVQYAIVYSQGSSSYKKRSERVFKSSRGGFFNGFYGSQWLNWTQKRWSEKNFLTASLDGLDPGTGYLFRMRYRSGLGWSEYSEPSPVYKTNPDVPSKPKPVACVAKTPNSALLSWTPPDCSNGAPVTAYVLQGRSVGDDFVELYNGPKTSHIVFSLFPEFAYSFRVAAVNSEGMSLFSDLFSVQTPPRLQFRTGMAVGGPASRELLGGAATAPATQAGVEAEGGVISPVMSGYEEAMRCRQAWKECWDERSQGFFYFNMMTGVRQRYRPAVWDQTAAVAVAHRSAAEQLGLDVREDAEPADGQEAGGAAETDDAMLAISNEISQDETDRQKENELRNKKFVLYQALKKVGSRSEASGVNSPNYVNGRQKLSVQRKSLLLEAFKYVMGSSPAQLRAGRLQVDFGDEEGIDSGGLSKEFFLLVSRLAKRYSLHSTRQYILNVDGKMFIKNRIQRTEKSGGDAPKAQPAENEDRDGLPPALPKAGVGVQVSSTMDGDEDEAIARAEFFYFMGRFMAKALLDRQFVDLALSPVMWKHLLSMPVVGHSCPLSEERKIELAVGIDDLGAMDAALSQSLLWMMNNPIEGVIDESFCVQLDGGGEMVPLCKDGDSMAVTDQNKREYVDLIIKWRTEFCVKTELDWFVRGFCEVVPRKAIIESNLSIPDLALILNGKQRVDVEEIRAYTIYQSSRNDKPNTVPFGEHSDSVSWLWMMLRKLDFVEQGKFLLFVTGTSCVPLDGYDPPFNITEGEDMLLDSLPRAHTCFNQIVLPPYSCYEMLREKILFAINNTEGFALS